MHVLLRTTALIGATFLALAAHGQIVRCTDARSGTVSYTDGDCPGGSKAREVLPRQTSEAVEQERSQAAQALERKQQRLQAQAAAARIDAEQSAQRQREQAARTAARRAHPQDYARSAECARARRNLDIVASSTDPYAYTQEGPLQVAQRQMELDCLGPEAYAEIEKNRPAIPAAPIVLAPPRPYGMRPGPPPAPAPRFTHCNVFRCYDAQGRSYTRP